MCTRHRFKPIVSPLHSRRPAVSPSRVGSSRRGSYQARQQAASDQAEASTSRSLAEHSADADASPAATGPSLPLSPPRPVMDLDRERELERERQGPGPTFKQQYKNAFLTRTCLQIPLPSEGLGRGG